MISPSIGFSLAVSGMMMPPADFASARRDAPQPDHATDETSLRNLRYLSVFVE